MDIFGQKLTGTEVTLAWIVIALSIIILVLSLMYLAQWIYYSWIRRNNSMNMTGEDITKHIFNKADERMSGVKIVPSFFYVKYWNWNSERATYKLRHWTFNRRSVWTMMEASQQAYVSTLRFTKGKTFWLVFRMPFFIKLLSTGLSIVAAYFAVKDLQSVQDLDALTTTQIFILTLSLLILFIGYGIADAGRIYILWKNVREVIKDSGLSPEELTAINRIFMLRLVLTIVMVISDIIELIFEIGKYLDNITLVSIIRRFK